MSDEVVSGRRIEHLVLFRSQSSCYLTDSGTAHERSLFNSSLVLARSHFHDERGSANGKLPGRTLKLDMGSRGKMCDAGISGTDGGGSFFHGFGRIVASKAEASTSVRPGLLRHWVKSGGKARWRA